jgi:hypothetical protein
MLGAGFGFGTSFWVTRFVRAAVANYSPERVSENLAGSLRRLGADVRAAAAEGREAMREREAELRGEAEVRRAR